MGSIYRKPQWKAGNLGGFTMDSGKVPPPVKPDGIWNKDLWSIRFDNQHIMRIMLEKPKMTVNDIITVIINEGGSVDANMVIHRG
ncbi:MAG: hypothetical protein IKL53_10145 [Lachnospiraceae bacterium]|nr:hypothetical protein [Lachnospiraceae bacterium]